VPILLKDLLDIDLSLPDVLPQGGLTEVSDSTSGDSEDASKEENEETQLRKWQKVCDHLWASHEVRNLVVRLMSFARASREKYLDTERQHAFGLPFLCLHSTLYTVVSLEQEIH
jgi:hypothetical protein